MTEINPFEHLIELARQTTKADRTEAEAKADKILEEPRWFYLRREPSREAALASLDRGRSLREWGLAGCCWRCQAEELLGLEPGQIEARGREEVIDLLELEPALWAGDRCGHSEPMAQYLGGLCALREYEYEDLPPVREMLAIATGYNWLPVIALFAGVPAGIDDEGWPLFHPLHLILTVH